MPFFTMNKTELVLRQSLSLALLDLTFLSLMYTLKVLVQNISLEK